MNERLIKLPCVQWRDPSLDVGFNLGVASVPERWRVVEKNLPSRQCDFERVKMRERKEEISEIEKHISDAKY